MSLENTCCLYNKLLYNITEKVFGCQILNLEDQSTHSLEGAENKLGPMKCLHDLQ